MGGTKMNYKEFYKSLIRLMSHLYIKDETLSIEYMNNLVKAIDKYSSIVLDDALFSTTDRIRSEILDKKTVYLKISDFNSKEFQCDLDIFCQEYKTHNRSRIMLDLRNNVGGNLENALFFLKKIVKKQRLATIIMQNERYEIYSDDMDENDSIILERLIVIVNSFTVSAAELVTGVLQYYSSGIIIGENTYGKNTIQKKFCLNKDMAVNLTVGCFYIGEDIDISGIGVNPDYNIYNCSNNIYELYKNIVTQKGISHSNMVYFVQFCLKRLKQYHNAIDGIYNQDTINAVLKYKAKKGIAVNDFISRNLISLLYNDLCKKKDCQLDYAKQIMDLE